MIVPSASGRRIARPCSGTPFPMPVFFRPQAMPAYSALAVRVLDGAQRALQADARAEQLPGRRAVARIERVAPADLPAVDPDELGERVEHALHREVRLVDAEAAHRAAGWVVRVDRGRLDVDVVDLVRAAGVARCALEHLVADARVGARVADDARAAQRAGGRLRRSRRCSRATSRGASHGSAGSPCARARSGRAARCGRPAARRDPARSGPPWRRRPRRRTPG